MELKFMGDVYPCATAIKDETSMCVIAYGGSGELVFKAEKVTDFSLFELIGGKWSIPEPTPEQRVSDLEEQLAQSDETAIALYEAQEAQEVINAQQDEALMEIYEMIG